MKTIALVLSSKWPLYYASSPYLNLLNAASAGHPDYTLFAIQPHQLLDPVLKDAVYKHKVVITDDINAHMIGDFPGLKLMIGGDPHAHRMDQVERLIKEYNSVDYVLTGAVFCKQLRDRYLYPPADMWRKHVYFPHMVPNHRPYTPVWEARCQTALMSGSRDPSVYPFRARTWELAKSHPEISTLDLNNFNHDNYFQKLADFRFAVTCSSNFEYLVAKYMEIPWLGTILIAPKLTGEECELIGLVGGMNCLWVKTPDEIPEAVRFANTCQGSSWAVSESGAKLMERHTAQRRLDYIIKLVERIDRGGFAPEDAKDIFLKHRKGELDAGLARDVAGE